MCLKFDNTKILKLQSKFTTPWNLDQNIVAYFSFLNKKQDKLLKWKVSCADTVMVIQDVSKMEVVNYFDSDDMIELEGRDESDQTFSVVQTFFKKKYNSCVKYYKKKHGKFEGANIIRHLKHWKEQLGVDLQDYLLQIAITDDKEMNNMHKANESTVTLNETLLQTIAAQNKKIDFFGWWRPSPLLHLQPTIKR